MIIGCLSCIVNDYFKSTGWILIKLGRNDPYMVLFKIVQMVPVHCISRSYRIKIDFYDENFKNLLF